MQRKWQWVEPMADAGATQYTFHIEASDDIPKTIQKIRQAGMKVNIFEIFFKFLYHFSLFLQL